MSTGTTSVAMHWIDGKWADSDEHRDSVNPATGEVIGSYAMGGPKEARSGSTTGPSSTTSSRRGASRQVALGACAGSP